jgi:16S rRNA (guanine(1405)-N(7))-methyltransferase
LERQESQLDQLVTAVRASARYRRVNPNVVANIGTRELTKRRSLKEAIKETKNTLHRIGGAYLTPAMDYARWLETLRQAAATGDPLALRHACRAIMSHHASTRERLPILDHFYATTLAPIAPVRSVLDVASGLNPLAIPWMPLAADAAYLACDMYEDMMPFIAAFMALAGVRGRVWAGDVTQSCPTEHVHVALKALPCLDQIDKTAGLRLLQMINADHLLVSFPVQSLGAREKGMATNYEARFRATIAGTGWSLTRFAFATELAFLVSKK